MGACGRHVGEYGVGREREGKGRVSYVPSTYDITSRACFSRVLYIIYMGGKGVESTKSHPASVPSLCTPVSLLPFCLFFSMVSYHTLLTARQPLTALTAD